MVSGKPGDHLHNLQLVLKRLEEADLHLNKDKCKFLVHSIEYLGYRIDVHGLHPLPDKVEAILNASCPHDITTLKAFLGFLNYYGKSFQIFQQFCTPYTNF